MILRRCIALMVCSACWIIVSGEEEARQILRGTLSESERNNASRKRALEEPDLDKPAATEDTKATSAPKTSKQHSPQPSDPATTTKKKKTKKKSTTTITTKATEEPASSTKDVEEVEEETMKGTKTVSPKTTENDELPAHTKETEAEEELQPPTAKEGGGEEDEAQKDTLQPDEPKPDDEQPESKQQGDKDGSQPDETEPEDSTSAKDHCKVALTCAECEKLASNSTLSNQTCSWQESSCKLVSSDEATSQNMCDETKEIVVVEEDEGSFMPGLLMLLIVASVIIGVRAYAEYGDVVIPGLGIGVATLINRQTSRSNADRVSSSRHRGDVETVPLATDDNDEWGWDDSGGDVELPTTNAHKRQEEEDLRMAMALSLSETPPPKRTPKQKPPKSGYAVRRTNSGQRNQPDWDDWDDESPSAAQGRSIPAPASAPTPVAIPNPPPTKITSLGVRPGGAVPKRKTEEKPKEDDIFASMGLSAKPNFASRPRASPPSSGGWRSTTAAAAPTSGLSAAADEVDEEAGSNWDDDSDLDDLLED